MTAGALHRLPLPFAVAVHRGASRRRCVGSMGSSSIWLMFLLLRMSQSRVYGSGARPVTVILPTPTHVRGCSRCEHRGAWVRGGVSPEVLTAPSFNVAMRLGVKLDGVYGVSVIFHRHPGPRSKVSTSASIARKCFGHGFLNQKSSAQVPNLRVI